MPHARLHESTVYITYLRMRYMRTSSFIVRHTVPHNLSTPAGRSSLTATLIELQLQRELDVVREGARLVVVKRVVEDREDALGRAPHRRARVAASTEMSGFSRICSGFVQLWWPGHRLSTCPDSRISGRICSESRQDAGSGLAAGPNRNSAEP